MAAGFGSMRAAGWWSGIASNRSARCGRLLYFAAVQLRLPPARLAGYFLKSQRMMTARDGITCAIVRAARQPGRSGDQRRSLALCRRCRLSSQRGFTPPCLSMCSHSSRSSYPPGTPMPTDSQKDLASLTCPLPANHRRPGFSSRSTDKPVEASPFRWYSSAVCGLSTQAALQYRQTMYSTTKASRPFKFACLQRQTEVPARDGVLPRCPQCRELVDRVPWAPVDSPSRQVVQGGSDRRPTRRATDVRQRLVPQPLHLWLDLPHHASNPTGGSDTVLGQWSAPGP